LKPLPNPPLEGEGVRFLPPVSGGLRGVNSTASKRYIDDSKITGELEAIQDSPTHVSILPRATMLLENYEAALANTQNDWEKV
jgi:hypothetical protein